MLKSPQTKGSQTAPASFHLLAKPTGAICNLNCQYCFFLAKEQLYPGSSFRMADDLLETYLQQLLAAHRTPEVTVAWQGGEPTLMGLDFFKRSIELVEKHKKPGQQVTHTLQTNGTRLDDDWGRFFKQHNFLVGLSVDGPQSLHDTSPMIDLIASKRHGRQQLRHPYPLPANALHRPAGRIRQPDAALATPRPVIPLPTGLICAGAHRLHGDRCDRAHE